MPRSLRKDSIPTNLVMSLAGTAAPCGYALDTIASPLKNVPNTSTNPGTTRDGSHTHAVSGTHTHAAKSVSHKHLADTGLTGCLSNTIAQNTGTATISSGSHKHQIYTSETSATFAESSASGCHAHNATVIEPLWYSYSHIKKDTTKSIRQYQRVPYNAIVYANATLPPGYTLDTVGAGRVVNGATYNTTGGTACHTHPGAGEHSHISNIPSHSHTLTGSTDSGTSGANTNSEQGSTFGRTPAHTHTVSGTSASSTAIATLSHITCHIDPAVTHEPAHVILGAGKHTSIGLRNLGVPPNGIVQWRCTLASIPTGFAQTDGSSGRPNYLDKFIKLAANTGELGNTGGSNSHQHAALSHTHTYSGGQHTHTISVTTGSVSTCSSPGVSSGTIFPGLSTAHTHTIDTIGSATYTGACNTSGYSTISDSASHQHAAATAYAKSIEVALIIKT